MNYKLNCNCVFSVANEVVADNISVTSGYATKKNNPNR
jgi:hypothetical protein